MTIIRPIVAFSEVTSAACKLLNEPRFYPASRPAKYQSGGISLQYESKRFNVSVEVDSFFQNAKVAWKVRLSSNATQLTLEDAADFASVYQQALDAARQVQVYLDSVEVDMESLWTEQGEQS